MENKVTNIAILGSTGSIGLNTLRIVELMPGRFRVTGLAAGANLRLLAEQVERFRPGVVSLKNSRDAAELSALAKKYSFRLISGDKGAEDIASLAENDIVVSAITGINGLRPTLAAVKAGRRVALANKESMVAAGALLKEEAAKSGAEIIPVDSEHSGIFQCLAKEKTEDVKAVILTASGGPFFRLPLHELKNKTVEEALAHPRWKMGKKVTVDSATLMNKGLELIEARWLFGLRPGQLQILIHPQSIVHSLVEMRDGSVLAQLSLTDMMVPIQYALTYPERVDSPLPSLNLGQVGTLEFYEVEEARFPLIKAARRALAEEKSYPVALNAANEAAVEAFLERRIPFSGISEVVAEILDRHEASEPGSLEAIFELDGEVRRQTEYYIKKRF